MPNVVQEGDRFIQGSVMVCGSTSIGCRTYLFVVHGSVTAAGYIEQILLQHVLVAAYGVGPEFVIMHDNARAHIAHITGAVFRKLDIQEMELDSSESRPLSHRACVG